MSNCCDIQNSEVCLMKSDLKPEFFEMVERAKKMTTCNMSPKTEQEKNEYDFYWFMSTNVKVERERVIISLGQARSSHTFRDLKGLARTMRKFTTGTVQFDLTLRDAENPQFGWFKERQIWGGPLPVLEERKMWEEVLKAHDWKMHPSTLESLLKKYKADYDVVEDLEAREWAKNENEKREPLRLNA